MVNLFAKRW
jgi:hypothetical protein